MCYTAMINWFMKDLSSICHIVERRLCSLFTGYFADIHVPKRSNSYWLCPCYYRSFPRESHNNSNNTSDIHLAMLLAVKYYQSGIYYFVYICLVISFPNGIWFLPYLVCIVINCPLPHMAISRGIDYYTLTVVDRSLLIAGIPIDSNA